MEGYGRMRKSRFTEEQIITVLRDQETGIATAGVCRKRGVSSATSYKCKAKYGGSRYRGEAAEGAGGRKRPAEADAGACDAGHRRTEGSAGTKVVTPAARREAVAQLRHAYETSKRRACRIVGIDRTSVRYRTV